MRKIFNHILIMNHMKHFNKFNLLIPKSSSSSLINRKLSIIYKNNSPLLVSQSSPSSLYQNRRINHENLKLSVRWISNRRLADLIISTPKKSPSNLSDSEKLEGHVTNLSVEIRRKGRVHLTDIQSILSLLSNGTPLNEHGPIILRLISCKNIPDMHPNERISLTQTLIQKIPKLSLEDYGEIFRIYAENEFVNYEPLELLESVKILDKSKNNIGKKILERIYYWALLSYCQRGDLEKTVQVLKLVKSEGVEVDESYFNSLIIANSKAGNLENAKEIITIMKASQVPPSNKTYLALMSAFIEHNDIEALDEIYKKSCKEVRFTMSDLIDLSILATRHSNDIAFQRTLNWLELSNLESDENFLVSFSKIINFIHLGHPDSALVIYSKLASLTPDFNNFNFVKELVSCSKNDLSTILIICDKIESQNEDALSTAVEFCLKRKRFDICLELFSKMRERKIPLRPHYFYPIIIHFFEKQQLLGLSKVLSGMRDLGVGSDWELLYDYILPRVFSIEKDPVEVGRFIKPFISLSSGKALKAILVHVLKNSTLERGAYLVSNLRGTLSDPSHILDLMYHNLLKLQSRDELEANLVHITTLLVAIYEMKEKNDENDYVGRFLLKLGDDGTLASLQLVQKLIQNLEKENVRISATAKEIIENREICTDCSIKVDEKLSFENTHFSNSFLHPREMDEDGLESHYVELKSKGMNARGVSRRLFIKTAQNFNIDRILELKNEFETEFGPLSTGMLSSLLGVYLHHKKLKEAEETYEQIKKCQGFNVDIFKFIDLISLIASSKSLQSALLLLESEIDAYKNPQNNEILVRPAIRLLDSFSSSDDEDGNLVLKVFNILESKKIIPPTSPILNIIIKHFIDKGQIEKALSLYVTYAKKYKKTPGSQMVLTSILAHKEQVEIFMKATREVHGETNAKLMLAFAHADSGNISNATAIFRSLERRLQFDRIEKQGDFLINRREFDKVLNLTKALLPLSERGGLSRIILKALNAAHRCGDEDNFRKLVDLVEDDSFVPSNSLLKAVEDYRNISAKKSNSLV